MCDTPLSCDIVTSSGCFLTENTNESIDSSEFHQVLATSKMPTCDVYISHLFLYNKPPNT